jgi:hypothetical protein
VKWQTSSLQFPLCIRDRLWHLVIRVVYFISFLAIILASIKPLYLWRSGYPGVMTAALLPIAFVCLWGICYYAQVVRVSHRAKDGALTVHIPNDDYAQQFARLNAASIRA